ncbi:MAG: hypothetical protein AB1410_11590 [Acidobacteriota bacterium]
MRNRIIQILIFILIVIVSGLIGFFAGNMNLNPKKRDITIRAFRYGYNPEIIRVNRGDLIRLRFISEDVIHGFYLEGYDLDVIITPLQSKVELHKPSQPGKSKNVEEVVFIAEREGKFRYRCSQTCGYMHPFMLGELIVRPNRLLPTSFGLAIGILIGGFFIALLKRENSGNVNGE